MPAKVRSFNCVIDDRVLRERFSAEVTLTKKDPFEAPCRRAKSTSWIYSLRQSLHSR